MLISVILVYVLIAIILGLLSFKTTSKVLEEDPLMKALLPPAHIRLWHHWREVAVVEYQRRNK